MLLTIYIYGVTGMKLYGNVCQTMREESGGSSSAVENDCQEIGPQFNFWSIGSSVSDPQTSTSAAIFMDSVICTESNPIECLRVFQMLLLFQLATGHSATTVMKDITAHTDGTVVFPFFCSFYIVSNYVLLNLFIAVLLENFELGVSADKFVITKDDIEFFKLQVKRSPTQREAEWL